MLLRRPLHLLPRLRLHVLPHLRPRPAPTRTPRRALSYPPSYFAQFLSSLRRSQTQSDSALRRVERYQQTAVPDVIAVLGGRAGDADYEQVLVRKLRAMPEKERADHIDDLATRIAADVARQFDQKIGDERGGEETREERERRVRGEVAEQLRHLVAQQGQDNGPESLPLPEQQEEEESFWQSVTSRENWTVNKSLKAMMDMNEAMIERTDELRQETARLRDRSSSLEQARRMFEDSMTVLDHFDAWSRQQSGQLDQQLAGDSDNNSSTSSNTDNHTKSNPDNNNNDDGQAARAQRISHEAARQRLLKLMANAAMHGEDVAPPPPSSSLSSNTTGHDANDSKKK